MTVEPRLLHLGSVWADANSHYELPLTNRTGGMVELESVSGDCTCLAIDTFQSQFRPGESRPLPLTLDLRSKAKQADPWEYDYQQTLTGRVRIGAATKELTWVISARVKTAILPETAILRIGTISVQQPKIQHVLCLRTANEVDRIDCDGAPHWSGVAMRRADSSREFILTLTPERPLLLRDITDAVRLTPIDRTGKRLPPVSVTIKGEFAQDVMPVTRALFFGRITVGSSAEEELRLRSLTGSSFKVGEIIRPNDRTDIDVITGRATAGEAAYTVRARAAARGEQSLMIAFWIEEEGGPQYAITVPVRYFGREAGGK